jgi:transcription initiation factor TFIIB
MVLGKAVQDKIPSQQMPENQPDVMSERIGTEERGEQLKELAHSSIDQAVQYVDIDESTGQLAKAIYHQSLTTNVIQNRTLGQVIAASMILASRQDNAPMPATRVSKMFDVDEKSVMKTKTELLQNLPIEIGPIDPEQYIPQYCEKLRLSDEVEARAIDIVNECKEIGLHSGRSPSAFAASAVYVSCLLNNEPKTQREVADVAGISKKTITNIYHGQVEHTFDMDSEE